MKKFLSIVFSCIVLLAVCVCADSQGNPVTTSTEPAPLPDYDKLVAEVLDLENYGYDFAFWGPLNSATIRKLYLVDFDRGVETTLTIIHHKNSSQVDYECYSSAITGNLEEGWSTKRIEYEYDESNEQVLKKPEPYKSYNPAKMDIAFGWIAKAVDGKKSEDIYSMLFAKDED